MLLRSYKRNQSNVQPLIRQNNHAAQTLVYDTGDMVQKPTLTIVLFLFEIAITIQQKDKFLNAKYSF